MPTPHPVLGFSEEQAAKAAQTSAALAAEVQEVRRELAQLQGQRVAEGRALGQAQGHAQELSGRLAQLQQERDQAQRKAQGLQRDVQQQQQAKAEVERQLEALRRAHEGVAPTKGGSLFESRPPPPLQTPQSFRTRRSQISNLRCWGDLLAPQAPEHFFLASRGGNCFFFTPCVCIANTQNFMGTSECPLKGFRTRLGVNIRTGRPPWPQRPVNACPLPSSHRPTAPLQVQMHRDSQGATQGGAATLSTAPKEQACPLHSNCL